MSNSLSSNTKKRLHGAFCSYCGEAFPEELLEKRLYPRHCRECDQITYRSFSHLSVVIVPVYDETRQGVLLIRRAIPPRVGMLTLPGGFIDDGRESDQPANESWQVAGAREAREELGLGLSAADLSDLFTVGPTPESGSILSFLEAPQISVSHLSDFIPNSEVSERVIAWEPTDLAFPTHTETLRWFLAGKPDSIWNFSPIMKQYRLLGDS